MLYDRAFLNSPTSHQNSAIMLWPMALRAIGRHCEGAEVSSELAAGEPPQEQGVARRSVLRGLGAAALATGAGSALAACSAGASSSGGSVSTSTINIGIIT